jgi:hypothetical protein
MDAACGEIGDSWERNRIAGESLNFLHCKEESKDRAEVLLTAQPLVHIETYGRSLPTSNAGNKWNRLGWSNFGEMKGIRNFLLFCVLKAILFTSASPYLTHRACQGFHENLLLRVNVHLRMEKIGAFNFERLMLRGGGDGFHKDTSAAIYSGTMPQVMDWFFH